MLTRRTLVLTIAALPLALSSPASAAEPEILSYDGAAIGGYDPVAYFTESRPVKGNATHSVKWKGADWRFASAENKAMFEADPVAYAPKYGGYCAYAASKGYVAPTAPEAWSVHEGRLYLNYSLRARTLWAEDIPGNISRADAIWPGPLSE